MSAWASKPPEELAAWRQLAKLAEQGVGDTAELGHPSRFEKYSQRLGPLLVDYSKQRINNTVRDALVELALQSSLAEAIADLFAGSPVNNTEHRPALHMELRRPANECRQDVGETRERFLRFAESIRNGQHLGASGKPVSTVVHIGIGGSHLGPELATQALGTLGQAPNIRFLANIDGDAASSALAGLDPATTLICIASKSFSTLEAEVNAKTARSWLLERGGDISTIGKHFVAITSNPDAAQQFGVPVQNCFPVWDWVGGRFSLWSAVGLPVAIALGRNAFEEILAGAYEVDTHFRTTPLSKNLPVLLALLQIWNTNFLGAATHAVLPYDRRLRRLPDYLQQLEMESNGKSVRRDGARATTHTVPVVWGGEETNGQHAFHQLLHQGSRAYSADFIACAKPGHALKEHHEWLLANCLAQSKAMMQGFDSEESHRNITGNHASTTILLDELSPYSLGTLLALYEHKVFCAGAIWQINPFDQFGVELGKALAKPIFNELGGEPPPPQQDFSTRGLVETIGRWRQ